MSWDSYIESLAGYGVDAKGEQHIDTGCIIGINGSKWTSDSHPRALKITQEQAMAIGAAFNSKNFDTFVKGNLKVEGVQYMFLRADDQGDSVTVFGKKKENGSIVLASTKTAIVIAHCPEGKQQGQASVAVAKIVEYLANQGM
jgi:profilin